MIGVHAPEFAFEKNIDNVRRAVKDMRIDYPVAVDNDYVIWRAFKNQYWPALYFIDAQGRVRHHHFGEGSYEQSEMVIQAAAGRGGNRRRSTGTRVGRCPRFRSGRRLGQPEVCRKTMSATNAPRTLRRPAGRCWTSLACMSCPRGCA